MADSVCRARSCQQGARLFGRAEEGTAAIEYSLLASLIAVILVVSFALLGGNLSTLYQTVVDVLPG